MGLSAKNFTGGNAMGRLKDKMFFKLLHEYFNKYLPIQRCASIHTIKAYRSAVYKLLEYIMKKKSIKLNEIGFENLDYETVNAYLEFIIKEQGYSQKTRNHRLNCILSFLNYWFWSRSFCFNNN